jgi:VanZ family protein
MPPGNRTGFSEMDHMKRLLRYMPRLFFMGLALLTILSLIPSTAVPQAFQFWDKAQHSLGYAVLSITGMLAFPQRVKLVCMGLLAHGAVIEIMQATLTTTRFGDVFDWLADGTGILVGLGFYRYVWPRLAGRPAQCS